MLQQHPEEYSATTDSDTIRDIFACYETIVMYIMNEKQIMSSKSVFLSEYLANDLKASSCSVNALLRKNIQLLAGRNLISFHTLVPFIYRYRPLATVGSVQLLKLVATMMLPDQVGFLLHSVLFNPAKLAWEARVASAIRSHPHVWRCYRHGIFW